MIQLTIDDKVVEVAEGRTILEACREHGVPVPTLCHHPALQPYGACRLCVVEASVPPPKGDVRPRPPRLVAACTYPCEPGLVVCTDSDLVRRSRRITAELLLAGAYTSPEIQALARSLGVEAPRYRRPEADTCVVCGLCVRACREIVGVGAISLTRRGMSKRVSAPFDEPSAACIACGTCVLICPTGHLTLADVTGFRSQHAVSADDARRYCQTCSDQDLTPVAVADVPAVLAEAAAPAAQKEKAR